MSDPAALAERIGTAFPTLALAGRRTLERIASRAIFRQVAAGTQMFGERQPCSGFPLVLSGNIRVVQRYPNGREMQLYRVSPGESCVLSSSCLLGRTQYPATGTAETDVELAVIPPDAFRELVVEDSSFREYVFSLFGERLASLLALVEAITYQKLDQRLAALLVRRSKDGPTIAATHQAIADELGSVREIVTRLLRSFEDRGYVELGRERIRVLDATALGELTRPAG
ncbi:MAG: Crp/Fnr family transcriptional regulator [Burkholderiales bacterium]|jgi:CRP/FNR family transcriptional regulator, anaerobic regulatory protein|nr:Crp/Fnr family transcriptional regulator [Burkholderiales bacterium]